MRNNETLIKGIEDFELLDKLGSGSYGDVVLAKSKEDQKLYAIKILEKKLLVKVYRLMYIRGKKIILSIY